MPFAIWTCILLFHQDSLRAGSEPVPNLKPVHVLKAEELELEQRITYVGARDWMTIVIKKKKELSKHSVQVCIIEMTEVKKKKVSQWT